MSFLEKCMNAINFSIYYTIYVIGILVFSLFFFLVAIIVILWSIFIYIFLFVTILTFTFMALESKNLLISIPVLYIDIMLVKSFLDQINKDWKQIKSQLRPLNSHIGSLGAFVALGIQQYMEFAL